MQFTSNEHVAVQPQPRSADWQSAVSQAGSLRGLGNYLIRLQFERLPISNRRYAQLCATKLPPAQFPKRA